MVYHNEASCSASTPELEGRACMGISVTFLSLRYLHKYLS